MFDKSFDRKKTTLLVVSIVGFFLIVGLVISIIVINLNRSSYGDGVTIQNFDKLVKNLPKERKDAIFASLHLIVSKNTEQVKPAPQVKDAVIREGSEEQTAVTPGKHFTGNFIVDIKSLGQSYSFQYSYSTDPNDGFEGGYSIIVRCPTVDELIYGDFNCKNLDSFTEGEVDPIIFLVPYSSLDFEIRAAASPGAKTVLTIKLFLTEADRRTGQDAAIERYKQGALTWIRNQGLDPNNYTIEYTVQ